MDIVSGGASEEGAVAAVPRFNKGDVRVGQYVRARFGKEADERIVLSAEDESGHGDGVDDASAGGAEIVVVGRAKSAIGSDDFVIELADGADGAHSGELIDAGEERCFAAQATFEAAQETPFVKAIGRFVKGVGAGSEVDGRADCGDGNKRRTTTPLSGKLEYEIASHGVAHQSDALEAEAPSVMADDGADVGGAAGVIESGRERIGAATIAHVHAHDVHAGGPCARGDSFDVAGIGGTFEPMNKYSSKARGANGHRLPVAMTEHAACVGGVDFDGF